MNLTPVTMKQLEERRRRPRVYQALVLAGLVVLIAAALILIVIPYAAGMTHFTSLIKKTGGSGVLTFGIIAAVLAVAMLAAYLPGYIRTRSNFAGITRKAKTFDAPGLATYLNALDGVADDSGLDVPHLAVLADELPNAMAFEGRNGPTIGVTAGLLTSDVPYAEAQAIMAHELASIAANDYLRPPAAATFEVAAYMLMAALALIGLLSLAMVRVSHGAGFAFVVAVIIWAFVLGAGLAVGRIDAMRNHDPVTADTIAAEITGKPEELESAIERLDGFVNGKGRTRFPRSAFGLDYMFVPPRAWNEDARAWLQRRAAELNYNFSDRQLERRENGVRESMEELSETAQETLDKRLENVRALMESGDE